jgi:hypothetical protein
MLTFPLHNAALDLKGKPPEELPHGLLTIPPEVRELVERQRQKFRPEVFAANEEKFLNDETVHWYFDGLGQEVFYRITPEGPEVAAVGSDEIFALTDGRKPEIVAGFKAYVGY